MKEEILFGTYTKKTSKGIYYATLDTEEKTISEPKPVVGLQSPTYMKVTNKKTLVSVAKKTILAESLHLTQKIRHLRFMTKL